MSPESDRQIVVRRIYTSVLATPTRENKMAADFLTRRLEMTMMRTPRGSVSRLTMKSTGTSRVRDAFKRHDVQGTGFIHRSSLEKILLGLDAGLAGTNLSLLLSQWPADEIEYNKFLSWVFGAGADGADGADTDDDAPAVPMGRSQTMPSGTTTGKR
eukprot:TRINITY_DN12024_c0_g2_i1.p1 TRINITY_DN12024_c0_g2~~TRINITY_DN12024_c0_g2_i1.p1  ORF type:complete len:157 (-),score=9.41 TRINITY_DN12024_c0_g2_i1:163-633(-)